jgi:N,N'-diacetyllegionaminate synthase
MEFTPEQWAGLFEHAKARGLVFLSSAFSVDAVALLASLGMVAWKVGSGEVGSRDLLDAMARAGGPVLLSTGMSGFVEVDAAVSFLRERRTEVALFQCTSRYPVPLEEVGLNVIDELRSRYACPAGLSDHSGSVYPALAAMARGADLIEAHIVFDKRMFGPDTPASLTVEDFRHLAGARDAFARMLRTPVDKDGASEAFGAMRAMFGKSLALRDDAPAGALVGEDALTTKKPGTGIPATQREKVVGRRLRRAVSANRLLTWEDFE